MGNSLSRSRYLDIAQSALENARDLSNEINSPPIHGVIVRYLEGRLDPEGLVEIITPLEVSLIPSVATIYRQILISITRRSTSSCG